MRRLLIELGYGNCLALRDKRGVHVMMKSLSDVSIGSFIAQTHIDKLYFGRIHSEDNPISANMNTKQCTDARELLGSQFLPTNLICQTG